MQVDSRLRGDGKLQPFYNAINILLDPRHACIELGGPDECCGEVDKDGQHECQRNAPLEAEAGLLNNVTHTAVSPDSTYSAAAPPLLVTTSKLHTAHWPVLFVCELFARRVAPAPGVKVTCPAPY